MNKQQKHAIEVLRKTLVNEADAERLNSLLQGKYIKESKAILV